ncbi:MAG: hypothetical protein Kow0069_12520 [Promethearchaeota archaeon]
MTPLGRFWEEVGEVFASLVRRSRVRGGRSPLRSFRRVKPSTSGLTAVRFKSRKNSTWLVERTTRRGTAKVVLKVWGANQRDRARNEFATLERLAGVVPVPPVLATGERALLLGVVPGHNLCDVANALLSPAPLVGLARWLAKLHATTSEEGDPRSCLLHGDPVLRNFTWDGNRVWGLDLEEARAGEFLDDMAGACASILNTRPGFPDPLHVPAKLHLARQFATAYASLRPWPGVPEALREELAGRVATALQRAEKKRADRNGKLEGDELGSWASFFLERLAQGKLPSFSFL